MKNTLLSVLAVALLLGTAPRAKAQEAADQLKPVLVVSFAGYAELKRDLEYLGAAAGNPDMAQGLEGLLMMMTQNQGLGGLDEDRPWGAAVGFGPSGQAGWAFLPMTDLPKLFGVLGAFNLDPQEVGDGIWQLDIAGASIYLTQRGKWTFVSALSNFLVNLPEDPASLLGDLPKQYDLAIRLHVQNIPPFVRDQFVDDLVKPSIARWQDSQHFDESQDQVFKALVERMTKSINELDEITLGFSIDRDAHRSVLEFVSTALEGSDTARQMGAPAAAKSQFAGFLLPGSLLSLHINSATDDGDLKSTLELLDQFRAQAMEAFDEDEDFDDEERGVTKEVVGELIGVVAETLKRGRLNLGLAVVGEAPFNLALGGFVADGPGLEQIFRKLAARAEGDPDAPTVKFDVAEQEGVRFHTLTFPASDTPESDPFKQLLGNPLTLTLGFGAQSVYAAFGPDGIGTIRQVMAGSSASVPDASQVHVRLSLGQVLEIAGKLGGDHPFGDEAALSLRGGDDDHLHVMVKPIANGVQLRVEVEEGILKLLGNAAKMAMPGGGNLR